MDVRLAALDDAEGIREIYNREVTGSTVTFDMVPRSLAEQRAWLAAHQGAHPAIVAVNAEAGGGETWVGFASLPASRDRPSYSTAVEDSVYVHHDHRGKQVGRLLLGHLVELA